MPKIEQALNLISDDGFSLDELKKSDLAIGFLSLRSALRAWFSTYESFRWQFHIVDPAHNWGPINIEDGLGTPEHIKQIRKNSHPKNYFEFYSETIFHFHHFLELIIKKEISGGDRQKLIYGGFSKALDRMCAFIDQNKLDNTKYNFLTAGKPVLQKLNNLRNRLVHQGTFVLPYAQLDDFIGKYLLPIVVAVLELPEYKNQEKFWKYDILTCELDPINEIIKEFQLSNVSYGKIAFLKELGRAALQSPVQKRGIVVDFGDRRRAEIIASKEAKSKSTKVYDVLDCPVCGTKSLARFYRFESENPDSEDPGESWIQTYYVQCFCCSFSIIDEISNASTFGLCIDDYWLKEDLV